LHYIYLFKIILQEKAMKKLIIIITAASIFILPAGLKGADYMVGVKAGYYGWSPFYSEIGVPGFSDIGWGSGVLAGPILSVILTPEISVSLSGLAGKQSAAWQSLFQETDYGALRSGNYSFDVVRGDFDFVISYRVAEKFRLLAGYKYLHMLVNIESTDVETKEPAELFAGVRSMDFLNYFHGPAIGVGYSHAFSQYYFTTLTLSGVYMWGMFKHEKMKNYPFPDNGEPDGGKFSATSMRQIGINIEPSIGMNPGNGLPIVMLGVRYQRFWVEFTDETDELPKPGNWFKDTLIGIFFSAVYLF